MDGWVFSLADFSENMFTTFLAAVLEEKFVFLLFIVLSTFYEIIPRSY